MMCFFPIERVYANQVYLIPPACKYNCDTSKWSPVYVYGMGLNTAFQLNGTDHQVRTYISSDVVDEKYGDTPNTDSMISILKAGLTPWNFRSSEFKRGEFFVIRYAKKEESYDSDPPVLKETEIHYTAFAVIKNYVVNISLTCDLEDSAMLDREANAVFDNIELVTPEQMDVLAHLPYTRAFIDSSVTSSWNSYQVTVDNIVRVKYSDEERNNFLQNSSYELKYSFSEQTIDRAKENVDTFRMVLRAELMSEVNRRIYAEKKQMDEWLKNGFSYSAYYGLQQEIRDGTLALQEYLDYLYQTDTTNHIHRYHEFRGGDEGEADAGIAHAVSREIFDDTVKLSALVRRTPEIDTDSICRLMFWTDDSAKARLVIVCGRRKHGIWKMNSANVFPDPVQMWDDNWEFSEADSSKQFYAVNSESTANTFLGTRDGTSWILIDFHVKNDSSYNLIYRGCNADYGANREEDFRDLKHQATAMKKRVDELYDLAYSSDTSEAVFWQSSDFRADRNERIAIADSMKEVLNRKTDMIKANLLNTEKLYVSSLQYGDIDHDGTIEAYYFGVSSGKLVDVKCFGMNSGKLVAVKIAGAAKYVQQTDEFEKLKQRSLN